MRGRPSLAVDVPGQMATDLPNSCSVGEDSTLGCFSGNTEEWAAAVELSLSSFFHSLSAPSILSCNFSPTTCWKDEQAWN